MKLPLDPRLPIETDVRIKPLTQRLQELFRQYANAFNLIQDGANPSGAVMFFAMATAPQGWLVCDGSAVSRSLYSSLFNALGTLYGAGDGSTTFNLPDLRGEFIRGLDGGRGVDSGRALGSSQADSFKSHTHTVSNAGTSGSFGLVDSLTASSSGMVSTGSTGGTETRPRNVALLACIKT